MFSSEVLTIERDGSVALLWLDSPERRNAMGTQLWADLPVAMAELSGDREVRCVVIAAKGPSFTVGLDLKDALLASGATDAADSTDVAGGDPNGGTPVGGDPNGAAAAGSGSAPSPAAQALGRYREIKRLQASITSVADCPKPTIAAVHRHCIGGGVDLITACDIRLCSADAMFSVRETRMAIVADLGTLQRLPRIVGPGHTAELVYTGKDIDATRAQEIGLVNNVYADAESTVAAAVEMAQQIAANSPLVVGGSKTVLHGSEGRPVADGLELVAAWNAGMLMSNDLMEAMGAFMEKRPAHFTGR